MVIITGRNNWPIMKDIGQFYQKQTVMYNTAANTATGCVYSTGSHYIYAYTVST